MSCERIFAQKVKTCSVNTQKLTVTGDAQVCGQLTDCDGKSFGAGASSFQQTFGGGGLTVDVGNVGLSVFLSTTPQLAIVEEGKGTTSRPLITAFVLPRDGALTSLNVTTGIFTPAGAQVSFRLDLLADQVVQWSSNFAITTGGTPVSIPVSGLNLRAGQQVEFNVVFTSIATPAQDPDVFIQVTPFFE